MSRNVDLTKPLKDQDPEDLRYAADRGLLNAEDAVKVRNFLAKHDGVEPQEAEEDPNAAEAYDPADHSVDEVLEYLEANPDQEEDVLAMERDGKARKGILGE